MTVAAEAELYENDVEMSFRGGSSPGVLGWLYWDRPKL